MTSVSLSIVYTTIGLISRSICEVRWQTHCFHPAGVLAQFCGAESAHEHPLSGYVQKKACYRVPDYTMTGAKSHVEAAPAAQKRGAAKKKRVSSTVPVQAAPAASVNSGTSKRRRVADRALSVGPAHVPAKRSQAVGRPATDVPLQEAVAAPDEGIPALSPDVASRAEYVLSAEDRQSIVAEITAAIVESLPAPHLADIPATHATPDPAVAVEPVVIPATTSSTSTSATTGGPTHESIDSVIGRQPGFSGSFSSRSLPLDASVPEKIRAKILTNQYFDLGAILPPFVSMQNASAETHNNFKLTMNGPDMATIDLVTAASTPKLRSFDHWNSAFNVFMSIYCYANPQDIAGTLKYVETLRRLRNEGGDWLLYDELYRKQRETAPGSYPWDSINWEMWEIAKWRKSGQTPRGSARPTSRPPPSQNPANARPTPRGFCFRFHNKQACASRPCPYKHACYKCSDGSQHPAADCISRSVLPEPSHIQAGGKRAIAHFPVGNSN